MNIESNICGVVLRPVNNNLSGKALTNPLFGKSLIEWVKAALDDKCTVVDYDKDVEIPKAVAGIVDANSVYTVVLFADTPLITKKTVLEAVAMCDKLGLNVLKMTRGYVFKSSYLRTAEKIFAAKTYFFDEEDFITAQSYRQLALISDILRQRILSYHMDRGVYFVDMASSYVDCNVVIGKDVIIEPNNTLKGRTIIKNGVTLQPGNIIEDSIIGDNAVINSSQIFKSAVGDNSHVGPYAHLRPDSIIGADCHIGGFVEIKKSVLGQGSKVAHLSYVGDCRMGRNCNIGGGVIFANYDGKKKHTTRLGDNVFVGSNSVVIAPRIIEDGAYIAGGSAVSQDIPKCSLAIARSRQVNKPDFNTDKAKY